jgi:S-adenosylhomocysteine hydrolase
MFFRESEICATEQPGLSRVIVKIDQILHTLPPGSVLRPEEIAIKISEKHSQVSGVMESLLKHELLYVKEYVECPKCETLNEFIKYQEALADEDSFECSDCQLDLTKSHPQIVNVYRINAKKIQSGVCITEPPIESTPPVESSIKIPLDIIEDPFAHTPLLRYYSRDSKFIKSQPFKDKRVFVILHFLRDLIPFVEGMKILGLEMSNAYFFYKDYPYPQKEGIKTWLSEQGAIVQPRSQIPQYLEQLNAMSSDSIGEILIVEDGGFIVPEIHQKFKNLIPHVIGAVEQTTRGIRNDAAIGEIQFPIISVATSKLKGTFEPPYIGRAVVENIKRLLPDMSLNGKTVGLFGYGTIGHEIAEWFRSNYSIVTVFDLSHENSLLAQQNGFQLATSPEQNAQNKNFVIGASGNESINSKVIAHLSHGTYIVSASSELYEMDIDELTRLHSRKTQLKRSRGEIIGTDFELPPTNRVIHVLANGYPINFWGFESMPNEASDFIMSLIFLCACELGSGIRYAKGIDSEAVNTIANNHKLAEKFLEIHKLG